MFARRRRCGDYRCATNIYQRCLAFCTVFGAAKTLLFLLCGGIVCIGYNAISGFRKDGGLSAAMKDSVESLAIGAVLATILSFLLGVVDFDMPIGTIVSRIAVETVPLALGASVANTQFGGDKQKGCR